MKNIAKGKLGEELAADFLEKNGFNIIEKNWRYSRIGEIDIIAFDREILVFIEVKARKSTKFGNPIEAVTESKINKIRTLAEIYLSNNTHLLFESIRFDVVGILLKKDSEIELYKDVYQF